MDFQGSFVSPNNLLAKLNFSFNFFVKLKIQSRKAFCLKSLSVFKIANKVKQIVDT